MKSSIFTTPSTARVTSIARLRSSGPVALLSSRTMPCGPLLFRACAGPPLDRDAVVGYLDDELVGRGRRVHCELHHGRRLQIAV